MKLGAHISSRKPFSATISRAVEIGCRSFQVFVNQPQRWKGTDISQSEIDLFNKANLEAGSMPIVIHSIYLLNLASSNPYFYRASKDVLVDEMTKAAKIGAIGANFHVGSTKGGTEEEAMKKVEIAMKEILDRSPEGPCLIIENSAGAGSVIGDALEEIAQILESVKSERVKVLIDTAHAFESGYDIRTAEGVEKFLNRFEQLIGLEKLVGFHLNDSKTDLSSHRDRHADIGYGLIGKETFEYLVNNPLLEDKVGILETPQEEMDWKEQLKLLRGMIK